MISSIVEQYAEQVSVAWLIRQTRCSGPQIALDDLANLEVRLEAHLDGLRIAGEPGWRTCEEALLKWRQPGEVFAAAALAVEQGNEGRVDAVLKIALTLPENERAFISALGWAPWEQAEPTATRLVASTKPGWKRIGIAGFTVHGRNPGPALAEVIQNADKRLKARALRAVGELARNDLLPAAMQALRSRDLGCKFAAAWTVALRSEDSKAVEVLKKILESQSTARNVTEGVPYNVICDRALQLVLRRMEVKAAAKWLNKLAQNPSLVRQAVIGSGAVGVPEGVPWLLQIMAIPALARVAGEAFTMITGVDLAAQKLEGTWPAGFEAGPNEDPADENVAMDEDENLPWPDAVKLAAWWEQHRQEFEPGTRYLGGKPLTEEWLEHVLRYGYQRQRAAAALELAIVRPNEPLFNVRAPAHRQQQLLGLTK